MPTVGRFSCRMGWAIEDSSGGLKRARVSDWCWLTCAIGQEWNQTVARCSLWSRIGLRQSLHKSQPCDGNWPGRSKQKKHQEAELVRRELISAFQTSERDGKRVWANVLDQLAYADLVSRTNDDDASLQDALRVLTAVESQITRFLDNDWIRGWWHGVMAALQDKLGQKDEALRHARVSLAKASRDLAIPVLVQDELVQLLVAQGQSDDAESVLRNTLNDRRRRLGDDHVITHYACADLAELLIQLKKYAEAESLLQQAQAGLLRKCAFRKVRSNALSDCWRMPARALGIRSKLRNGEQSSKNRPFLSSLQTTPESAAPNDARIRQVGMVVSCEERRNRS